VLERGFFQAARQIPGTGAGTLKGPGIRGRGNGAACPAGSLGRVPLGPAAPPLGKPPGLVGGGAGARSAGLLRLAVLVGGFGVFGSG
jgi:hypothetical protein